MTEEKEGQVRELKTISEAGDQTVRRLTLITLTTAPAQLICLKFASKGKPDPKHKRSKHLLHVWRGRGKKKKNVTRKSLKITSRACVCTSALQHLTSSKKAWNRWKNIDADIHRVTSTSWDTLPIRSIFSGFYQFWLFKIGRFAKMDKLQSVWVWFKGAKERLYTHCFTLFHSFVKFCDTKQNKLSCEVLNRVGLKDAAILHCWWLTVIDYWALCHRNIVI